MSTSVVSPSPLGSGDPMLELLARGEHEAALRRATPVVKGNLQHTLGLLVMGRALAALKREQSAVSALELALSSATRQSLPLAIAACFWLSELGVDVQSKQARLAELYAKSSRALRRDGPTPPKLESPLPSSDTPLDPALTAEAVLDLADQTLEYARAAAEGEPGESPRELVPQQLFSSLSEGALGSMIRIFTVEAVPNRTRVLKQGTTGDEALIVARGELEVERVTSGGEPAILARLAAGSLVGEMALLARAPRTASVVTCRPSILLKARKSSLDHLAATEPQIAGEFALQCRRRMMKNLLATSSMLKAVAPEERNRLIEHFKIRSFEPGEKLISLGQPASGIHLIASGSVRVMLREKNDSLELTRLGPGDSIGEVATILRRNANADVIAEFPTITLFMGAPTLTSIINEEPLLLAQLYALAVMRDEETHRIAKEEAKSADDFILV